MTSAVKATCKACSKSMQGDAVYALNNLWHPNCFTCTECKKAIAKDFQERDGKPFCPNCYADKFNPKCVKCAKTLRDTCIAALDKSYHEECFKCASCKSAFKDGQFYWLDDAYCLDCHWGKRLAKLNKDAEELMKK